MFPQYLKRQEKYTEKTDSNQRGVQSCNQLAHTRLSKKRQIEKEEKTTPNEKRRKQNKSFDRDERKNGMNSHRMLMCVYVVCNSNKLLLNKVQMWSMMAKKEK